MTKETSHAQVTDPNAELAGSSQHSIAGMIALVIVLILLALAGWSLYDWNPKDVARAPAAPTSAPVQ